MIALTARSDALKAAQHLSDMACHDLQVMEEVLDALADSVQKQQRAKDEVQQRFNEEAGQPGCQKQRKKDLTDRLQVEDAKLQKKQQNLREAQSVQESWQGVRPLQSINIACMGRQAQAQHCAMRRMVCRRSQPSTPASAALQAPAGIEWLL